MRREDFDNIISAERLIIADFYASRSGACRAMNSTLDRVVFAMSEFTTLVRIDTSSHTSSELVRRYNISSVPTIMLFYRGDMLWRHSGIISFERLCSVIRRYQTVSAY